MTLYEVTPPARFPPGAIVRCRSREWVVLPSADEDVLLLRPLAGDEVEIAGIYRPLIEKGLEPVVSATFPPPDPDRAGDFASARLLWDAARLSLRDGAGPFRSLGRLSVRPRAYQYVPLVMALRQNPVRLLISDDVGVGKTIEAGLVAREMLDRGEVSRLCVLCPPYLADQWATELSTKFHLEPVVIRGGTAARLERDLPPGAHSIFSHYPHIVVSIDYAKSDRHRHAFLAHCPDFVIIDEAHGVARPPGDRTNQMQRHRLAREVCADLSRHVLLLTATPHSGFEDAFISLLGLLDPALEARGLSTAPIADDGPLLTDHFVQRRRADIADWLDDTRFPTRKSREESYALSAPYRELFNDVYRFAQDLVQSGESLSGWARRLRYWTALALLRCVMSSPAAAVAALEGRLSRAGAATTDDAEDLGDELASSYVYDASDSESVEDVNPSGLVDSGTAGMSETERKRFRAFRDRAAALAGTKDDKKLTRATELVVQLLEDGHDPIVWCRYIATAHYVADALTAALARRFPDTRVLAATGDTGEDERRVRVAELEKSPRRVLVATDCLSEGINLQDGFSSVVHYDLPWNPNRLEQREGRVDRFGQGHDTVHAVLLYGSDNAIDGAVLEVLLRKAQEIYRALGTYVPVPANSEGVMEAILRHLFLKAGPEPKQLDLLSAIDGLDVGRLHALWDNEAKREAESRARFSQAGIKPEEIRREVEETDRVLGDPAAIARFVTNACQRLDVAMTGKSKGAGATHGIAVAELPSPIRARLAVRSRRLAGADAAAAAGPWRITFDLPPPEGVDHVGRNHPLVAGLAAYLLEGALDPRASGHDGPSPAARCGVIRTNEVARRTTMLLLRLRYLLEGGPGNAPMLAEEVVVEAFHGAADAPEWLEEAACEALLATVTPAANVSDIERETFLGDALAGLSDLADSHSRRVAARARRVEEAHLRVRTVLKQGAIRAVPHEPPDVLGLYVLLPNL